MLAPSLQGHEYEGVDVEGSSRRRREGGREFQYVPCSGVEQRGRPEASGVCGSWTGWGFGWACGAEERARGFKKMGMGRWARETEMTRES